MVGGGDWCGHPGEAESKGRQMWQKNNTLHKKNILSHLHILNY